MAKGVIVVMNMELTQQYIDELYEGVNRRNYHRVRFTNRNLCAFLRIYSVDGNILRDGMKRTRVCVENISAGGMAFVTSLNFPIEMDYTIILDFTLLGEEFSIESVIVRKREYEKYGLFEYGASFVMDDNEIKMMI